MDTKNKDVSKKEKKPLYLDAFEQIREIISKEHLRAGDKLPSESELVSRLGVSRGTIRQALMLLREGGLIYSHHRKGYFVVQQAKNNFGLENTRIDLLQFSLVEIEKRTLVVDYAPNTKSMKESYLENSDSPLLARFHFRYYHDNSIIAYQYIFIPFKRLEESNVSLEDIDALTFYIDNLMQNLRTSIETTIDCVKIREDIAEKMDACKNAYVYSVSEKSRDKTGTVIAYSTLYGYPEYFKFKINRTLTNT